MLATVNSTLGGLLAGGWSSFAGAVFIDDGELAFSSQFGGEGPDKTPFSIDSTYVDLNSVVKLFTAIAIAIIRLIDDGAITSFDDPVNRYLKHFKLPQAFGHDVTIRELATHSAGFDANDLGAGTLRTDPARFFAEHFPGYVKDPQKYSAYDGYGPQLLDYLVSEITGKSFSHYVRDSMLRPLRMGHTHLTEPAVPLTHRVMPFQPGAPAAVDPVPPLTADAPAQLVGESVSALSDMAILVRSLVGPAPDQDVIKPHMRNLMFSILQSNGPYGSAHGLLFDIVRRGARTLLVHGGVSPGVRCMLALDIARDAGLFYCYGDARPRLHADPRAVPP